MEEFVSKIRAMALGQVTIDSSIHGIEHWEAVHKNALFLGMQPGVDLLVVRLFSYIHDCKREDDGYDEHHGARAAHFVQELADNGHLSELTTDQIAKLVEACHYHNLGAVSDDQTVGACFDADRLDLLRSEVTIVPDPKLMNTPLGIHIAEQMRRLNVQRFRL